MNTAENQNDYVSRVNVAIDHVIRNLDSELNLHSMAEIAGFSPFHFHRIFKSVLGETLKQFVKRQRLERALYMMSHMPKRSLTDICMTCGFASSSDFSRSFKARYGKPPSAFDVSEFRNLRRIEFENIMSNHENGPSLTRLPTGENPDNFEVTIRDLPPRIVAYIRALNPYQSNCVIENSKKLVRWAESNGLAKGQWLGYMWEDPEIVALADCRYDTAVVIENPEFELPSDGDICRFDFPEMTVANVEIAGDIQLEQRALDWLYGTWLPRSGYIPDDQPAFEAWNGKPFEHGYEYFELSCQLPIRRQIC